MSHHWPMSTEPGQVDLSMTGPELPDGQSATPELSESAVRRLRHSIGDMVRSLAVVLGIVAIILVLTHRADPDPVKVIDPAPMLAVARMQADFPVLMPQGVDGLRATSARWATTPASEGHPVWHVGFLTKDGQYVQVSQSAADGAKYLAEQTVQGRPDGTVVVVGEPWELWRGATRTSLVRITDGATTVVSSTLDERDLQQFVTSLRAE